MGKLRTNNISYVDTYRGNTEIYGVLEKNHIGRSVRWHSHLLPSIWKWSCHNLIFRRRYVVTEIQTPNPTRARRKLWTTVPTLRYVCCRIPFRYILNACRWQISWNVPFATDSGEEFILCNDYSLLHFSNDPANILNFAFFNTLSGIHRLRKAYKKKPSKNLQEGFNYWDMVRMVLYFREVCLYIVNECMTMSLSKKSSGQLNAVCTRIEL